MTAPAGWPAAIKRRVINLNLFDISGKRDGGVWEVEPQRNLVWAADPSVIVDKVIVRVPASSGKASIALPVTDQAGWINGEDGAPVINWPYRFAFKPNRLQTLRSQRWHYLPTTPALEPVGLGALLDIGGWAEHVVIVNQPASGGTGGGSITTVETSPGSGAYIVTVT
jgi:hypothetical protein